MQNLESRALTQKDAARRNADRYFATNIHRADPAKQQAVLAREAGEANTLRLRALRLAKEETERQALALPVAS